MKVALIQPFLSPFCEVLIAANLNCPPLGFCKLCKQSKHDLKMHFVCHMDKTSAVDISSLNSYVILIRVEKNF
jgi:hypothetical protein